MSSLLINAVKQNDFPQVNSLLIQYSKTSETEDKINYQETEIKAYGCLKYTALYVAAVTGNIEILTLLLVHGANPNIADDTGNTPLHIAVAKNSYGQVKELLSKNIDPKNIDSCKNLAEELKHDAIVKLFKK